MPYFEQIMKKNFVEYASYVIKERSIPHLDDGCKPVQRRVLHTMLSMDDGKFYKVANVTGECMKYHPHGNVPIFEALVTLANKELFMEKQGNFGNILTGDPASAARYIECRISKLGRELLYKPEITQYIDTYDGRNKEPVTFPAKIPIVLITGAEGIAVVMATSILPHNFCEVIQAVIDALEEKPFTLYPDFLSAALMDVSEYQDGMGKVKVRAKLDISDPKRVVIREVPFGITTEKLMTSIENAARNGKISITSIDDYTRHEVEIVLHLSRGVHASDVVESLYAFTDCQCSISVNPMLIVDNKPKLMSVSDIIAWYKKRAPALLKAELEVEEKKTLATIHARTLERIFIEQKIYKTIEDCKSSTAIISAVTIGLQSFQNEIGREINIDDIERLLKIPIRRISAYDIEKHKKELIELTTHIKEIRKNIKNIRTYTIAYLRTLVEKYGSQFPRKTTIMSFETVSKRDVAQRNLSFFYNKETGYIGYALNSGKKIESVSHFDKILIFKQSGIWMVRNVEAKHFIGKDVILIGLVEKEKLEKSEFTAVYTDKVDNYTFVKRFKIEKFLVNKTYNFIPNETRLQVFTTKKEGNITLKYKPIPRIKKFDETFAIESFILKGISSKGVRLATKIVKKVSLS